MWQGLTNVLVSFVVGSVGATIVAAVINKRFAAATDVWKSQRGWKERAVTELLGPIYIQLDRTKRAFDRWDKKNLYLEAEVVRSGNLAIRDLLLTKPHLIPPELRSDASALILHYDVWLEEFNRVRQEQGHTTAPADFTFAGPLGYGFPKSADANFRKVFETYWYALYESER
jgi:hypothetical protein